MQCPQCAYQSRDQTVRCPQCRTAFGADDLEELAHLTYLRSRLDKWQAEGRLPTEVTALALQATEEEVAKLELRLGLRPAAPPGSPKPEPRPSSTPALAEPGVPPATLEPEVPLTSETPASVSAEPPAAQPSPPAGQVAAPRFPKQPLVPDLSAAPTSEANQIPTGAIQRQAVTGPAGPSVPVASEPARPAFAWGEVGTYLLSERTLHALLALGTFLILASGVVISAFNPTGLSPWLHFGAVAATTVVFYAVGYVVRKKLNLATTGTALLAIGAAFIPLDIWTLGRDQLLSWEPGAKWLVASLVCLPIYLASHAVLRDRTFAVLTALAGGSELLAVLHWLGVPREWAFCGLMVLALSYALLSRRLRESWDSLAWAFFWAGQVVTPLTMAGLVVAKFFPIVWQVAFGSPLSGSSDYAIGIAWWLGTAFYALGARLFRPRRYQFLAAWTLPGAFLLTLTKAPWDAAWYNVCLALLATGYLISGRWIHRARAGNARARRSLMQVIGQPAYQVGLALTVIATLWPWQSLESRILTLYLVAASYVLATYLFRHPAFRYTAAYLPPVAVGFSLQKLGFLGVAWSQPAWHNVAFALLAAGYLLVGRFVPRTAGRGEDTPGPSTYQGLTAEPVYQVALLLTGLAGLWPLARLESQIITLCAVAVTYGSAAFLLRQRVCAYAAVSLLPVVFGLLLQRLEVDGAVQPLAWAILAAALLAAAEIAVRRTGEARRPLVETTLGCGMWRSRFASPLFSAGYLVSLIALGLALARYWTAPVVAGVRDLDLPVILAILAIVALYSVSAATRRTSFFLYPATWLFLIPFVPAAALIFGRLGLPLSEPERARLLAGLGLAYLAVAYLTDRAGGHYAKPIYLVGYALSLATMFLTALDRAVNVQIVGLSLLIYAGSAWLVHRGRHPSYQWVIARLFRDPTAFSIARTLFLYLVAWLFPVWLLLAMSLRQPLPAVADYGLALALLAPVYVALGAGFRRIRPEYRLPWQIAGYALSAIGPIVTTPDPTRRILALAVSIALYIASTVTFRRSAFLYEVALLTPVLLWQILERFAVSTGFSSLGLVILALGYGCLGLVLHHGGFRHVRQPINQTIGAYALPFFIVGYGIGALGLALLANQESGLVVLGFSLGGLLYAGSGLVFRQSLFAYPLAGTAAVAYLVGMTMTPLEARYYGLGLLPGIAAYLIVAELLRRRLDVAEGETAQRPWGGLRLDSWATPFAAILYAGTIAIPFYSRADQGLLALAWWSVAAVYGASAALFRHPAWLYPTVGAGVVGYLATVYAFVPSLALPSALATLVIPTWVLFWLAYAVSRLRPVASGPARWPLLGARRAMLHPWAAPLLVGGIGTLIISVFGSAPDAEVGLWTAAAYLMLLTTFAFLWPGEVEVWASLGCAGLAFHQVSRLLEVPFMSWPPGWAVAALALALLAVVIARLRYDALAVWRRPLYLSSIGLGALALVVALGVQLALRSRPALQPLAATVAVTGLTLVAHGFNQRKRHLGYLGVAFLLVGYLIQLIAFEVGQPQAFVLPVGLYLLTVAYLEWRRGTGVGIKDVLELSGLGLLLGTSLVQAIGFWGAGLDRSVYDIWLLFESLALFSLGAILRWKKPFFGGSLALVADVLILLADPVRAMNTWYLLAMVGILMIGLVIFVERQRQRIPIWIDEWRVRLETWN